jgi:hypothetical protein
MKFGNKVVVIARWDDPEGDTITLQDFIINGQACIPVFSNEERFDAETRGSGFEKEGVVIDRTFLASILSDAAVLVLNPGSSNQRFTKADLEAGHVKAL